MKNSSLKPGDEVILSSLNFVGVSQAISATGAKPVFCDVNDDMTIDIEKAEIGAGEWLHSLTQESS